MFNMSTLLNQKDSRWLQLEVCREYQRQKCTRSDCECKFAHPPPNVEVQNGRVTACYDSIKGRCNREKPACKYFHPPQHLKDQLLINGRNHLALKNALAQQMQQQIIPGQVPTMFGAAPYIGASVPTLAYSPYLAATAGLAVSPLLGNDQTQLLNHGAGQPQHQHAGQTAPDQQQLQQQSKQRNDRIETCREFVRGTCVRGARCRYMHHVYEDGQHQILSSTPDTLDTLALPAGSVLPYKRAASEKSGLPVYQPAGVQQHQHQQQLQQQQAAASAYHQILQMQQQPSIVPASYGNTAQALAIPRYQ